MLERRRSAAERHPQRRRSRRILSAASGCG